MMSNFNVMRSLKSIANHIGKAHLEKMKYILEDHSQLNGFEFLVSLLDRGLISADNLSLLHECLCTVGLEGPAADVGSTTTTKSQVRPLRKLLCRLAMESNTELLAILKNCLKEWPRLEGVDIMEDINNTHSCLQLWKLLEHTLMNKFELSVENAEQESVTFLLSANSYQSYSYRIKQILNGGKQLLEGDSERSGCADEVMQKPTKPIS